MIPLYSWLFFYLALRPGECAAQTHAHTRDALGGPLQNDDGSLGPSPVSVVGTGSLARAWFSTAFPAGHCCSSTG